MRPNFTGVAGISCILAGMAGAALAQDAYVGGDKVTVLMGFAPGGGSDALAQLVQPLLAEELGGVSFVNQYQPGATGAIAWTQLAKQVKPDGQTISVTNTPMLMTNYIMNDAITYTIEELDPIANIVTDPGIAAYLVDSWGYGSGNAKGMATVDPAVLQRTGYADVEKFTANTLFQAPVPSELKQKMIAEFEKIKSGY